MNLRRFVPRIALCLLGTACFHSAYATTFSTGGVFTADNNVFEYDFSTATTQLFTIDTTSYAAGGFLPALTLFTGAGAPVDSNAPGEADAMLTDMLTPGSYILTLTEFPNEAIGTYAQGFLFSSDPNLTGTFCGTSGRFLDDVDCSTQRTGAYAVSVNSFSPVTAATPEPSSWLLLASGAVVLAMAARRQRTA